MDNVGKVRNARNHQPQRPYDRHKSLLGRVSDSVKEMLSPSWLVDLVQSVKKKTPPANPLPSADASRSADPVARQMLGGPVYHLNRGTNLSQSFPGSQENGLSQGMTPSHEALQMTSASLAFPSPLGQLDLSTNSLLVNGGDEHSELNDYTLAGPSCNMRSVPNKFEVDLASKETSRIQQMRHEYGGSVTPSKEIEERAHSLNTFQESGQQQMGERSFLWSGEVKNESYSSPQPPAKRHKPSFNLSLFGGSTTTMPSNDASSSSFHESSFYPGKTTFGGASSHRKNRAKPSTPRVMTPTRKQVQAKPLNQPPGGVTSSTARKILDSLERMSTPLSDVKKIPSYNSSLADSPLSFSPGVYRRRYLAPQSTTDQVGPPVKGLSSPGQVRVAKNLQKPAQESAALHRMAMSQASKTTDPVFRHQGLGIDKASKVGAALAYQPVLGTQERPDASHVMGTDREGHDTEAVKSRTGKMKRERSTFHSSRKGLDEDDEQAEVPNLSTGFTLPASDLSKIDLKLPALARPPLHSPLSYSSTQRGSLVTEAKSTSGHNGNYTGSSPLDTGVKSGVRGQDFTFSSPISQGVPSGSSPSPPQSQTFKFRSPLKVDESDKKCVTSSVTAVPQMQFSQASAQLKKKVVQPVIETPVTDSGGGGYKPAEKLKAGSVMDFLKKGTNEGENDAVSTGSLSNKFKAAAGSWECPTCMVSNKADHQKCPCCETRRPDKSVPSTGIFRTSAGPESSVALTSGQSICQPPLNVLFSKPSNKWECSTCMVSNDNTHNKCPCCLTDKPGSEKKGNKSQEKSASNKEPISSLFKPDKDTWECAVCMLGNKEFLSKCVACETPNPSPPKTTQDKMSAQPSLSEMFKKPGGSWECDTCMVTNKDSSSKCIACESPKPGLKSTSSFTSAGGFQLGSFSSKTEVKPAQEAGFKMPASFVTKDSASTSGGIKTSSDKLEAPLTGGFSLPIVSKSSDSKTAEGFKPSEPLKGGFTFGGPVKAAKENSEPPVTGGLQFEAPIKTDDKQTSEKSGFTFGVKLSSTETKKTESSNVDVLVSETSTVPTNNVATTSGLSFGAQDKSASEVKIGQPLAGGFSFGAKSGPADSENKSGMFSIGQGSQPSEKQPDAVVNFTSQSVASSKESKTEGSDGKSISGFKFGGSNVIGGSATTTASSGSGIFAKNSSDSKPKTEATVFQEKPETTPVFGGSSSVVLPTTTSVSSFTFTNKSSAVVSSTSTTGNTGVQSVFNSNVEQPKKEDNKPSGGLFVFGQTPKVDSTKTESSGGFNFKPSAESTPKPSVPGGFSFGATVANNKPGEPTKPSNPSTFVFGAKKDTGAAAVNLGKRERETDQATPAKKGNTGSEATFGGSSNTAGFSFGQNTTSSSNPFGSNANQASGVFGGFGGPQQPSGPPSYATATFGSSQPNSTPTFGTTQPSSAPTFGSSQSKSSAFAQSGSTSGFGTSQTGSAPSFGSSQPGSTPAFGSSQPTTFGSSTVFGPNSSSDQKTTTTTSSGGLFQFGATTNQSNNNQSSAGYNFGSQASNQTAPQPPAPGGFNFAATPSFNFGGNQPAQQLGAFQFSATSPAPPENPFNAAPTSTNTQGARKIKRAVRKLRKQ